MTYGWSEAQAEQGILDALAEREWEHRSGPSLAPGSGERDSWHDIVLRGTLLQSLINLNPDVPEEYLQQAMAEVTTPKSQDAVTENHRLHHILLDGYKGLTYIDDDGREVAPVIRFLSADASRNRYHAVDQVTVRSREHERRFDVVAYVNGLPLAIFELKKPGAKNATAELAYNQLRTYLHEFPMAFRFAVVVVATDDLSARYGTPFTPWNHFAPWNVDDDGRRIAPFTTLDGSAEPTTELDLLIDGVFNVERFGQLHRDFTAFDATESGLIKRIAKPHQYFAVTKAVGATVRAVDSDGRAGVVWHTQGSGKSMEMELYTAKIMRHPRLANPTVIVITDRTELDSQLFDGFQISDLLPEQPVQVRTRDDLRTQLADRRSGGIYFTTLQKFGLSQAERDSGATHPLLSDRRNIVVIADEAHRSHYDNLDGYAAHLKSALPHATLIAFTGTPITEGERDTRRVFGADIDVYDLHRAVEDGATVPVVYEPRLISLARLPGVDDESLDDAAEEALSGLDAADAERLQRAVAKLDTVYGAPERIRTLAADLVTHWETRRDAMRPFLGVPGKAMIVCATRSIAANLYQEIVTLRPDWHSNADDTGKVKVVYSADPGDEEHVTRHLRRPSAIAAVKQRVKNPDDELELIIVKDMMLTGFDAPALHTLYVDRPLRGALLMQTLARVNRTFRGKQDGLLVGYAPLTDNLSKALEEFTREAPEGRDRLVGRTSDEAAQIVLDLLAGVRELIGDEWKAQWHANAKTGWRDALLTVVTRLRSPGTPGNRDDDDPDARPLADRFRDLSSKLARAWALAAGLDTLTPQWVEEAQKPSKAHLAIEALKATLLEEAATVTHGNEVRRRLFSERVNELMVRYTNQQLTAAEVIAELVELAKEVSAEADRGQRFEPPLESYELAFYDVVALNESAVDVLGDDVLAEIARSIVATMRRDIRTDWTVREDVKAKLRASVKRTLRKYKYPPDKQPEAIQLVMQQMEALAPRYAEGDIL